MYVLPQVLMDAVEQALNGVIDCDPVELILEAMKKLEELCTLLIATNISTHTKHQNTSMLSITCCLGNTILETPKNGCCELLKDFDMI